MQFLNERIWKTFERHICTGEEGAVQMCMYLSPNSSIFDPFTSKITRLWSEHLKLEYVMDTYKLKEFSAILNERISKKGIFVQVKIELYKCVFLSEFINVWPV